MKTNCEHWFWGTNHSFSEWEIKNKGSLSKLSDNNAKIGTFIDQERTCSVCCFVEINTQSEYI